MIVYRLSKSKYSNDLSGRGAEQAGGRWNSKGLPMLYTSASRALCTTEVAVHVPLGVVPLDYVMVEIEIPDKLIQIVDLIFLPNNWKEFPHTEYTKKIGNEFLKNFQNLTLKVPSAVVNGDFNYLINPLHKDFSKLKINKIEPFEFDRRLFVK